MTGDPLGTVARKQIQAKKPYIPLPQGVEDIRFFVLSQLCKASLRSTRQNKQLRCGSHFDPVNHVRR